MGTRARIGVRHPVPQIARHVTHCSRQTVTSRHSFPLVRHCIPRMDVAISTPSEHGRGRGGIDKLLIRKAQQKTIH